MLSTYALKLMRAVDVWKGRKEGRVGSEGRRKACVHSKFVLSFCVDDDAKEQEKGGEVERSFAFSSRIMCFLAGCFAAEEPCVSVLHPFGVLESVGGRLTWDREERKNAAACLAKRTNKRRFDCFCWTASTPLYTAA